jgi:hypothetical protein
MTRTKSLSFLLVSILPFGALAPACSSPSTSTKGQLIECATDPATGVVLSCKPTDSTTTSGANTCLDVDEDGDGEPGDSADGAESAKDGAAFALTGRPEGDSEADDDADGVPDSEDCDHHPGEDDDGDASQADLPYDIDLAKGQTTTPIADAFAKEGPQPAAIVSVTGATWRITELAAGTPFVVTDADCTHVGTADVGRDRVIVTWKDPDGTTHSDHLDLRYCR